MRLPMIKNLHHDARQHLERNAILAAEDTRADGLASLLEVMPNKV